MIKYDFIHKGGWYVKFINILRPTTVGILAKNQAKPASDSWFNEAGSLGIGQRAKKKREWKPKKD